MDVSVSWSAAALDDVDAIAEYIHRDSPAYASAVVNKILEAANTLEASRTQGASRLSSMTKASVSDSSTATG